MKKLVCDRCGLELTEKEDVETALDGQWAWEMATRAHDVEPRGVLPCENFVRCGGEMKLVRGSRVIRCFRWLAKTLSRKGNS